MITTEKIGNATVKLRKYICQANKFLFFQVKAQKPLITAISLFSSLEVGGSPSKKILGNGFLRSPAVVLGPGISLSLVQDFIESK